MMEIFQNVTDLLDLQHTLEDTDTCGVVFAGLDITVLVMAIILARVIIFLKK